MSQPNKTLLLAVTGLSPQVVTETLYAIHKKNLEWPSQIKILTTKKGYEQARLNLIVRGKLKELCQEYNLPLPSFSEDDIEIIPDANKNPVDDAITLEDQEALANHITKFVGTLAADDTIRIHASIAGGRKTMTFFLGYAMTIFGRDFDRLSHVLVSSEFESNRDFYFPTKASTAIDLANGETADSQKAQVMLAEIPFVSQRNLFSEELMNQFKNFDYNTLVSHIRLAQRKDDINLTFNFDRISPFVKLNDITIDFSRRQLDFAFYAMLARPREAGDEILRPKSDVDLAAVTSLLYRELAILADIPMDWHRDEIKFLQTLEDLNVLDSRSVAPLLGKRKTVDDMNDASTGLTLQLFDSRLNYLSEYLQTKLPSALVDIIKPQKIRADKSQHYHYTTKLAANQVSFSHE